MSSVNGEIEIEAPLDNGTSVSWIGRGGIEQTGAIIGYLDDGLYLVNDEDDHEHEIQFELLTVLGED